MKSVCFRQMFAIVRLSWLELSQEIDRRMKCLPSALCRKLCGFGLAIIRFCRFRGFNLDCFRFKVRSALSMLKIQCLPTSN
jgi:hypothetical protein